MEAMTKSNKKTCNCKLNTSFNPMYLDKEGGDKSAIINKSLLSLSLYKSTELAIKRSNKLRNEGLNTLIELVRVYMIDGSKCSIDKLLGIHGYTKSSYYAIYQRIEVLYRKGLVDCDKKVIRCREVNYFYPTESGVKAVLSLLD